MEKFAFLSVEWTQAVRSLHDDVVAEPAIGGQSLRMNLVLTGCPFDEATIDANVDTSSGELVVSRDHLEDPDITITLDYDTAKAILVEGDMQAAMTALMEGRIKIDGDMSLLLALQNTPLDPNHRELARRIREITE